MRRSELYEKVWSEPVGDVARTLGISGVALGKTCRRHGIPVPPRGYWARRNTGRESVRPPLPKAELDTEIPFPRSTPEVQDQIRREQQERKEQAEDRSKHASDIGVLEIVPTLERPHPFVKRVRAEFEGIEKQVARKSKPGDPPRVRERLQHGRYSTGGTSPLDITAAPTNFDWVLRFHDTVLKALVAQGFSIRAGSTHEYKRTSAAAVLNGEELHFSFLEGYRKVPKDPEELAQERKRWEWASAWDTVPSGKFYFRIEGTEFQFRAEWKGSAEYLEDKLSSIVADFVRFVPAQAEQRTERLAAEKERTRSQAIEDRLQAPAAARRRQFDRALVAVDDLQRYDRLGDLLERLGAMAETVIPEQRTKLRKWRQMIEGQLADHDPIMELANDILRSHSYSTSPPEWWPDEEDDGE